MTKPKNTMFLMLVGGGLLIWLLTRKAKAEPIIPPKDESGFVITIT